MELVVQREELLAPLQALIGVTEKGQTLPILANVKLQVKNDEVVLTTTNLEIEMTCSFPHTSFETGGTTVPAKKFLDVIKSLPQNIDVKLIIEDSKLDIIAGRSKFALSCLPINDFPVLDHIEFDHTLTLPKKDLRKLIQRVSFAMASADVRYFLNGMLLDITQNQITSVATDGHRLSCAYFVPEQPFESEGKYIVPRKAVEEILKLLENESAPIHIQLSKNHLRLELGSILFTTKLIEGNFPDYTRVIPPIGEKIIVADRVGLLESLNRASILSQDKFRGIRFTITNYMMRLMANNPEQEVAEEEVEVNYYGEDFAIAFNVNYITEALKNIESDMVQLSFTGQNTSCLIKNPEDDTVSYVVMPMRL